MVVEDLCCLRSLWSGVCRKAMAKILYEEMKMRVLTSLRRNWSTVQENYSISVGEPLGRAFVVLCLLAGGVEEDQLLWETVKATVSLEHVLRWRVWERWENLFLQFKLSHQRSTVSLTWDESCGGVWHDWWASHEAVAQIRWHEAEGDAGLHRKAHGSVF